MATQLTRLGLYGGPEAVHSSVLDVGSELTDPALTYSHMPGASLAYSELASPTLEPEA